MDEALLLVFGFLAFQQLILYFEQLEVVHQLIVVLVLLGKVLVRRRVKELSGTHRLHLGL